METPLRTVPGPRSKRAKVGRIGLRDGVADVLTLVGAIVAVVVTFSALVSRLDLGFALPLGYLLAVPAAIAGAMLTLIWTIPLRSHDILSVRSRFSRSESRNIDVQSPALTISVIVPVYNGREYLTKSLPPLLEAVGRGEILEVLVADDGATDGSAEYARELGAKVISSGGRKGPGEARNVASKFAKGDVLWFIDADVVIADDSPGVLARSFGDPALVAVFGSYDDRPAGENFASQYKNLVHHHYHQNANPNATTFWSGCGAVRAAAFAAVGGFDGVEYGMPSVEDIDLGCRLREAGGQIFLNRDLLSTHLKVWSIFEVVRTDVFRRAIPWARMMLRRDEIIDDLNVGTTERLRAAYAGLTAIAIVAAAFRFVPWWFLAAVLTTNVAANWHLFKMFVGRRGLLFGAAGLVFHQVYYLYSSAAFVACWLEVRVFTREAFTV